MCLGGVHSPCRPVTSAEGVIHSQISVPNNRYEICQTACDPVIGLDPGAGETVRDISWVVPDLSPYVRDLE